MGVLNFFFGCPASLANLKGQKNAVEGAYQCARFGSFGVARCAQCALRLLKLRKFVNWPENLAEFCNLYTSNVCSPMYKSMYKSDCAYDVHTRSIEQIQCASL